MNSTRLTQSMQREATPIVPLKARNIALVLGGLALLLALISLSAQLIKYIGGVEKAYGMIPTMDVDREPSAPTMYSVLLLFMPALLLGAIAILKIKEKDRFRGHWMILALGFCYMAFDEGASIHELVVVPIRKLVGGELPGFLTFVWIVPGMAIVAILAVAYLRFMRALPRQTSQRIIIAGGVYLSGLIAMEMVGGVYAHEFGIKDLTYNLIVTHEELLEMEGSVLFIYALLDYIARTWGGIRIRIGEKPS